MEAFEKWFITEEGSTERGSILEEQKVAWRAGLKWVLDQMPDGKKLHISMLPDLFEKIEYELESK